MLSILIPCYNFDVCNLVHELHQQACISALVFEIICLEDASGIDYVKINSTVQHLSHVQHDVLPTNVGRAKIRNILADRAQYPFLLFMDCDAWPPDESYIQRYVEALDQETILYGGRCYQPSPPTSSTLYFHWYYGQQREEKTAQERQKAPYHSFMTNNFLISKQLFSTIKFEERLTQYGHEDTLFGLELARRQYAIVHLDNPLEHIGLEPASTFLNKSKQALQNLWYLYQNQLLPPESTRLLAWYHKIKRYYFSIFLLIFYHLFHRLFLAQLQSKRPILLFFDFYKLCYLAYLNKSKKNEVKF
ncbi:MAG: glycosyltransferase family 2 protein [Aureispira sp.]